MIIELAKNYTKPTFSLKKETFVEITEEDQFNYRNSFGLQSQECKIKSIKKLPTTWKESFLIEFDLQKEYSPCDSIGLYIPNMDKDVDDLMSYLELKDEKIKISRIGINAFEYTGTIRDFIKNKMDIKVIPKKKAIYNFIRSSDLKDELEYLVSKEGQTAYLRIVSERWTLLDFLITYRCKPSFEDIAEYCDLIKPRYYTMVQNSGNVQIVLSVNIDKIAYLAINKDNTSEEGTLPSSYENVSAALNNNNLKVEITFKKGHVSEYVLLNQGKTNIPISVLFRSNKLFSNVEENLVCFCTGTGITPALPFYNTLYKNRLLKSMKIIYGYRNKEDNLLQYLDKTEGVEVVHALSSEKDYVYNYVKCLDGISDNCTVFICGNMTMQRRVFEEIMKTYPLIIEKKRVIFDNWS